MNGKSRIVVNAVTISILNDDSNIQRHVLTRQMNTQNSLL